MIHIRQLSLKNISNALYEQRILSLQQMVHVVMSIANCSHLFNQPNDVIISKIFAPHIGRPPLCLLLNFSLFVLLLLS